jgi:hypothetical protein
MKGCTSISPVCHFVGSALCAQPIGAVAAHRARKRRNRTLCRAADTGGASHGSMGTDRALRGRSHRLFCGISFAALFVGASSQWTPPQAAAWRRDHHVLRGIGLDGRRQRRAGQRTLELVWQLSHNARRPTGEPGEQHGRAKARCREGRRRGVGRAALVAVPLTETVHVAHAPAGTPAVEPRGGLSAAAARLHTATLRRHRSARWPGHGAGSPLVRSARQRQTGSDRLSMGAAPPLLPRWHCAARMP